MKAWAVIMAGGSGTRFWPESRRSLPKQFLPLFGPKTLLEQTRDRLLKVVSTERILVFTAANKVALTRKLLKLPASQVIGEPVGRNTAPCAAWAASLILSKDPSAVIGIFPSDHFIHDERAFAKKLRLAYEVAAQKGMPVTLGVKPDSPHTGYGYLEMGPRVSASVSLLKRFHEKPDRATAEKYCRSGKFLWNAGIFVWHAGCLLETVRRHLPDVFKAVTRITGGKMTPIQVRTAFAGLTGVSIDHGLMEKLSGNILTVPVAVGWNDVGGWAALRNLLAKDAGGNAVSGHALLVDSADNLIRSKKKLIAAVGLKKHVVVETDDAILVCPIERAEEIRKIVQALTLKKMERFL